MEENMFSRWRNVKLKKFRLFQVIESSLSCVKSGCSKNKIKLKEKQKKLSFTQNKNVLNFKTPPKSTL